MSKRYVDCILAEPDEGCQPDAKSAFATILLLKTYKIKVLLCYHLPFSLRSFKCVFFSICIGEF